MVVYCRDCKGCFCFMSIDAQRILIGGENNQGNISKMGGDIIHKDIFPRCDPHDDKLGIILKHLGECCGFSLLIDELYPIENDKRVVGYNFLLFLENLVHILGELKDDNSYDRLLNSASFLRTSMRHYLFLWCERWNEDKDIENIFSNGNATVDSFLNFINCCEDICYFKRIMGIWDFNVTVDGSAIKQLLENGGALPDEILSAYENIMNIEGWGECILRANGLENVGALPDEILSSYGNIMGTGKWRECILQANEIENGKHQDICIGFQIQIDALKLGPIDEDLLNANNKAKASQHNIFPIFFVGAKVGDLTIFEKYSYEEFRECYSYFGYGNVSPANAEVLQDKLPDGDSIFKGIDIGDLRELLESFACHDLPVFVNETKLYLSNALKRKSARK